MTILEKRPAAWHGAAALAPALAPALAMLVLAMLAAPLRAQDPVPAGDTDRPPVEKLMTDLLARYKQDDKKYATLAQAMDKAVRAAIDKTEWLAAGPGQAARAFKEHPYFTLVNGLSDAARADAGKRKTPSPAAQKLIARFPWEKNLELVQGLEHGSDRAIPDHENGFIDLGSATVFPGYPDLPINQYLYGLDEIVGWQFRVKTGKKLAYEGRGPKDGPVMAGELPSWEQIHVYLQGTVPAVPLQAIPWLTHAIHARLAERRRSADGTPAFMDQSLAFMDSRWNGFFCSVPYSRERLALAMPVHALYSDTAGFVFQFPIAARYAKSGDIPFLSVVATSLYAQEFDTENGTLRNGSASAQLDSDSRYLARYKTLIDEVVRAVLAPNLHYPRSMKSLDYPPGPLPSSRAIVAGPEIPRPCAVLLWAAAGKDPVKVADFLHDNLLDKAANRFPADVYLQTELTSAVREHRQELLAAVCERIAKERGAANVPGDFEREFSPYPTYLELTGAPALDYLMESFTAFHGQATAVVQDAAYALALKETAGS